MNTNVRLNSLEWDNYRVEHVARHNEEPDEVQEICDDPRHVARAEGHNRYRLYGQTRDGRYLFVVLEQISGATYRPITAREMTDGERRGYRRVRR